MRSLATWLMLGLCLAIATFLYRTQPGLRRRVGLALRVALVGYGLLFLVRLARYVPQRDELVALAVVFGVLGAIWLTLWLLVRHRGGQAS